MKFLGIMSIGISDFLKKLRLGVKGYGVLVIFWKVKG